MRHRDEKIDMLRAVPPFAGAAPSLRALIESSHALRVALLHQIAGRVRTMDLELQPAS